MDTEATREQEFLDHKEIMEKLRQLTAKCDTLFALYENTPQDLTAHNLAADAHPPLRRTITTLDEREADHYSEINSTIDQLDSDLTAAIENEKNNRLADSNSIHNELSEATNNITNMQNGDYFYTAPINSSIQSKTYIDGNKGKVIVNSTADAGYTMLYRIKSTGGVYTGGVYNQRYILNYTDDNLVNNGINKVTYSTVLMDENGNASFANGVTVKGTLTAGHITGTLDSKAPEAALADKATRADLATRALNADNASNADNAKLAARATLADNATNAANANKAARAESSALADKATNAVDADHAAKADLATNANHAYKADLAVRATDTDHAVRASNADAADIATRALNSDKAALADVATNANHAYKADLAVRATDTDHAVRASNADAADIATRALNSDKAALADVATISNKTADATDANFSNITTGWIKSILQP